MPERDENEFRAQRIENMRKLEAAGGRAYGGAFERSGRLADIRASFKEGLAVRAAGRLLTVRNMGKSSFCHLGDGTDRFQIYVQRNQVGEESYELFKLLDVGDHIGVEGELFMTRTGEQTLRVDRWSMLAKALLPLPEKWHGLKDVEARYRHRYLDLIANPESRELFNRRSRAVFEIRRFLVERGFAEVETPMLQPQAGGAAAKPFVTHYEALHTDMFMRIAPELYLKRLLVGGFDRVFELNRNFRNEGLSRTHNPEFTMLEVYEAFGDVSTMKTLVQEMVTHVAREVFGTLRVGSAERPIDLTPPWREATYAELVAERMGADWPALDLREAGQRAAEAGVAADPAWDRVALTQEVFEKLIERTLEQPTFVTRLPRELVPLAAACTDDPGLVDVFELIIGGKEIAPGYTELNDPIEQARRLREQAGGDESAVDRDFVEALEYGMPPAGGMGIGIDRLMMILSGAEAIRDVILFPQLRPRKEE